MSPYITYPLAFIVVLGVMIVVHELGHFIVAKLLGVRVEQFAIGFGKRLVGFKKGDTDYRINALPLGGYVKMSGENPMDDRTGDPGEFMSHPRWHRFLIAIAGPAMNIVFAIGLLTVVFAVHFEYPAFWDKPAVIAGVKHNMPAATAGFQAGDRIVRIDDIQNPTWEQVFYKEVLSPNQPMDVTVQRGSETLAKQVVPKAVTESEVGSAGWYADEAVIVGKTERGMPAANAGILEDDKIVAMDGKPLQNIDEMIERLQVTKDKPIDFTVLRNGQTLRFQVQPSLASTEISGEKRYRIGFSTTHEMKVIRLPFVQAFQHSLERNKKDSLLILELVQKLVKGKISLRTVSGPIGIAQQAGEAAQEKGWMPLVGFTAAISLNLGIMNLLPIPILDGGVILLLFIEGLMRRDISLQIKERIYQVAFVFLILFAAMIIYTDLAKTLPGMMQKLP